jgi:hypothetical protein
MLIGFLRRRALGHSRHFPRMRIVGTSFRARAVSPTSVFCATTPSSPTAVPSALIFGVWALDSLGDGARDDFGVLRPKDRDFVSPMVETL